MAVRNPTQWSPPTGKGYVTGSSNASITSQDGTTLTDQSGVSLIINPAIYQPEYATSWTTSTKNKSTWQPGSGSGYVISVGAENLATNLSQLLTDNIGNFIVTTPTYDVPKNATAWTLSGV